MESPPPYVARCSPSPLANPHAPWAPAESLIDFATISWDESHRLLGERGHDLAVLLQLACLDTRHFLDVDERSDVAVGVGHGLLISPWVTEAPWIVQALAETSPHLAVIRHAAQLPEFPSDLLVSFALCVCWQHRAVAAERLTDADLLTEIEFAPYEMEVHKSLAANPLTPSRTLERIAKYQAQRIVPNEDVVEFLIGHPELPRSCWALFAGHSSPSIRDLFRGMDEPEDPTDALLCRMLRTLSQDEGYVGDPRRLHEDAVALVG